MKVNYPPSPKITDDSLLEPSAAFVKQAHVMIRGIVGFVLLYLFLIIASLGLVVACGFAGIGLIILKPMFITLAAGLGIVVLGIMVFLFLIKFIFAKTQVHDPQEIEITEKDQPALFEFIRKLTQEIKTDFPKRIFIVPEVNAYVSYNSSFWSMFLPIRKNLRIGLGLVNALTLSEFKAVLAHEFGHFSQRSMKLGSYVYTMNKVIFDLVNHRDRWDNLLEGWASAGGIFGAFAGLTFWIVNQVRRLLIHMYTKLNVHYMALSREMEYHADLVACSVAGNQPMIQTLRKIEFTDGSYQHTLNKLNQLADQKKKCNNIYLLHKAVSLYMANSNNLQVIEDSPVISDTDLEKNFIKSRLNFKDQWASHPSREEREQNINKVQLTVDLDNTPAWVVFTEAERYMESMTTQLYDAGMPNHHELDVITVETFMNEILQDAKENSLADEYNGFYDNRMIHEFDVNEASHFTSNLTFHELFGTDSTEFFRRHDSNQSDLEQLKNLRIVLGKNDTFEFDFVKYRKSDLPTLISNLEKEIEADNQRAIDLDRQAFLHFYGFAKRQQREQEFVAAFQTLFSKQQEIKTYTHLVERIQSYHHKMATQTEWTERQVSEFNGSINFLEKDFKKYLTSMPELVEHMSDKDEFEKYTQSSITYMLVNDFNHEGFQKLTGRMFEVLATLHKYRFSTLKELTKLQLDLATAA